MNSNVQKNSFRHYSLNILRFEADEFDQNENITKFIFHKYINPSH